MGHVKYGPTKLDITNLMYLVSLFGKNASTIVRHETLDKKINQPNSFWIKEEAVSTYMQSIKKIALSMGFYYSHIRTTSAYWEDVVVDKSSN